MSDIETVVQIYRALSSHDKEEFVRELARRVSNMNMGAFLYQFKNTDSTEVPPCKSE